jgi:uncharacterized protein
MAVSVDFLAKNIVEFVEVLREAGVRASTSETIDAVSSLKYINVLEKRQVKAALSTCFAKSEEEKRVFAEAFDRFFIIPEDRLNYITKKSGEIEQRKNDIKEEFRELKFQGEEINISDELKEVYSSLNDIDKQNIKDFLEKTSTGKNVKDKFKPLIENIIKGKLSGLKQNNPIGNSIFSQPYSEAGIIAGDIIESIEKDNELLYKDISAISEDEIPKIIDLIKHTIERLKRDMNKRYKITNRRARLDIRKTIRNNLSTGGVFFRIKYKTRKKRKDRFLILCDVSASMYRFSGFALQFINGMHLNAYISETFIFSEDAEHINTRELTNPYDFEQKVKSSPVWRKGTNINRV